MIVPHGLDDTFGKTEFDSLLKKESGDVQDADEEGYTGEALEHEAENSEAEGWTGEPPPPIAGKIAGSMEQLERIQSSELACADEVQECIKYCLDCYQSCTETVNKCLTLGGEHVSLEQLNLLTDCARISSLNADFMIRNSPYYPQTCGITADICDECADTCDRSDDDFLKECASACRQCAESCRELAR